ncbi:hypothetical protein A2U01_0057227, partial [Trifolium medium]|nr:hypothetical protein [Trifolium medium]
AVADNEVIAKRSTVKMDVVMVGRC